MPKHIDEWIDDHSHNENEQYAKWMFNHFRLPAVMRTMFDQYMADKKLFCTYEGKIYRVTGASRLGDVWLTSNYEQHEGYEKRVMVDECSNWSAFSDIVAGPNYERGIGKSLNVHAEIEYINSDGVNIHSDICPPDHLAEYINGEEYKKFLHECLDEWLEKSNGTGQFYIANEDQRR